MWPFSHRSATTERTGWQTETYIESVLTRRPEVLERGGEVVGWERLREGTTPEIWRLDQEHGGVIARFWKVEPHCDRASEHVQVLRILREMSVPTPQLVDSDLSDRTARHSGFRVTIEERLEGRHLSAQDLLVPDVRHQMVSILSRLHHVMRPEAGRPWRRVNEENPWAEWMRHRIGVLTDRARAFRPREKAACAHIRRILTDLQPRVADIMPFCMTHGDFQPSSFFRRPGGKIAIVDIKSFTFTAFEMDLVAGEEAFDLEHRGSFASFLEDYFSAVPSAWRLRHGRHVEFFRGFACLRRAVAGWQLASTADSDTRRARYQHRADHAWKRLIDVVGRLTPSI